MGLLCALSAVCVACECVSYAMCGVLPFAFRFIHVSFVAPSCDHVVRAPSIVPVRPPGALAWAATCLSFLPQHIRDADDGEAVGLHVNSCADRAGREEALGVAAAKRRCMTCARWSCCARLQSSRAGAGSLQPLVRPLPLLQPDASC